MKVALKAVQFKVRGSPISATLSIPFNSERELANIYRGFVEDFIKNHLHLNEATLSMGVSEIAV